MENAFFQLRSPYIEYSSDSNDVLFDFRCRPANGAVHKYLHSSIRPEVAKSYFIHVPERFTSNLKYITSWKIVRNQTMHLKKAPVLILLVWKLMCLEAGKFILILYFTPYNRTISMSKTVIDVGRSVHYLRELTGQEKT